MRSYFKYKDCKNGDTANQVVIIILEVAHEVCFALKSWKEPSLIFTYLITLGKDITLTKFKTNRSLSYFSVNRIPN